MAKSKSKNKAKGQQKAKMSPERFMREKARNLPLGKCYVAPTNWQEAGMAHVIVQRMRPSGNIVLATFLVDSFCLGVKNAFFHDDLAPRDFEMYLQNWKDAMGVEEISYNEAHNIIFGAIAFAEDGGIEPDKSFKTAGYILEEDTDDIPLIEYNYGKDGKHLLIVSPERKEMPYLKILQKNLGDNFDYILPLDSDYDDSDDEFDDDFDDDEFDDDFDDDEFDDEDTPRYI